MDFSVLKRSFDFLATTYYSGYVTSHLSVINAGPKIAGNYIAGFTEIWGGSAAGTFTMYFPYALAEGENINDSLSFQEFGLEVVAFRYTTDKGAYSHEGGEWYPEVLDHCLGVYFKDIEGGYHYGWIRCDVKNSGKEITVKDFAYEAKCDVGTAAATWPRSRSSPTVQSAALDKRVVPGRTECRRHAGSGPAPSPLPP